MFVIAGASGRTGKTVAETLLAEGARVRLVVRDAAKVAALTARDARSAETVTASLDDAAALERALAGASGFFTLLPEDPTVADFHAHRLRMVEAMASAIERARVPHVVLLSAAAASLAEGNGPARELHHAERTLRAVAPALTVLRACYFQDNVLGAVATARQAGIYPSFFPPELSFPTVATRDAGKLAARMLLAPSKSQVVDLIGPLYSAVDIAARLGAVLGSSVRAVEIPADRHIEVLTREAHLPEPFAAALAEMFACLAAGRISPAGDRLERGETTLDQVLREALA